MVEHGTTTRYSYGCRCEWCRAAQVQTAKDKREYWGNPDNYDPEKPWHGTFNGYASYGCRCEECKAAAKQHRLEKKWKDYWR